MPDWPIERRWRCHAASKEFTKTTVELRDLSVLCLLGAGGLGKTHEMRRLQTAERGSGSKVLDVRLAQLALGAGGLAHGLERVVSGASPKLVLHLDALDESMVPERFSGLILENWIRDTLSKSKPVFRVSCRSAVWPGKILTALSECYGKDNVTVAVLEPLAAEDVASAAEASSLDGAAFLKAVDTANAMTLASHPVTLKMLLRQFEESAALPARRGELFDKGVRRLVAERERRLDGTARAIPEAEILKAAEWVACLCMLSGRETVDLSDTECTDALGFHDISEHAEKVTCLTHEHLVALSVTGLCEGAGTQRFRFAHRQLAEYLAGRKIANLLPHQGRSLLRAGLGWQSGVAGPLRETAAFAANENEGLAQWISDTDPILIGQSDVAEPAIRRKATLALIRKCESHQMTDAQIREMRPELEGLKYPDASADLRPVLGRRGAGTEDVLELVIELAKLWNCKDLSDDLCRLALDSAAPFHARLTAAYALYRVGSPEDKARLLPLASGVPEDDKWQLRGLALRCNWPDRLDTRALLALLPPRDRNSFTGAYEGFLFELDRAGFQADGARLEGLAWAAEHHSSRREHEPAVRIAQRICHAALNEVEDHATAKALARVILAASRSHANSPLTIIESLGYRVPKPSEQPPPPLKGRQSERRYLLDALAEVADDSDHIDWVVHRTPEMYLEEDCVWLMARASDTTRPMEVRRRYAELAQAAFRWTNLEAVETWWNTNEQEPVKSVMNFRRSTELGSTQAEKERRRWVEMKEAEREGPPKPQIPAPNDRVRDTLEACERRDYRFFHDLCRELTLKAESENYDFERFLVRTPGWQEASADTRRRIVGAARAFLEQDQESSEAAEREPLNRVFLAGMAAMWLVEWWDDEKLRQKPEPWRRRLPELVVLVVGLFLGVVLWIVDWRLGVPLLLVAALGAWLTSLTLARRVKETQEPSQRRRGWLEDRSDEWWSRWAWYILRELHPNMSGEDNEMKLGLLNKLRRKAPQEVRRRLSALATSPATESQHLLESLLSLLEDSATPELDEALLSLVDQERVPAGRLGVVTEFVLRGSSSRAAAVCLTRFEKLANEPIAETEHPSVGIGVALLTHGELGTWDRVLEILRTRPDVSRLVLAGYAHSERMRRHNDDKCKAAGELPPDRLGLLARRLLEAFPPESDPSYEGAHTVKPSDSGRSLRDRLLSHLGDRADRDSVEVLKALERDLGHKYSWLRRPRARAEDAYRKSKHNPVPLPAIVDVLRGEKRLVRSAVDIRDGVVEAIRLYGESLRHTSPSGLEDLWNTPRGVSPTAKEEERCSDKLCAAIRAYFQDYAVTADREVQVRRKAVVGLSGYEPGSYPDVVVSIPAVGSVTECALVVPVEVKLSSNTEAKTNLASQLANRYMSELGVDVGVYVVMWMNAPGMTDKLPVWVSPDVARQDLEAQATAVRIASGREVSVIVVDCSLR